MKALLFWQFKKPNKGKKPVIQDFIVSFCKDETAAKCECYRERKMSQIVEVQRLRLFAEAWRGVYKMAVIVDCNVNSHFTMRSERIEWIMKELFELINGFDGSCDKSTDISWEIIQDLPLHLLPQGYEFVESGIVEEDWMKYDSYNNRYSEFMPGLVGTEVSAYIKKKQFRIGLSDGRTIVEKPIFIKGNTRFKS